MRGRSPTQSNIRLRYALCRNTVPFKLLLMPGQMSGPRNGGGGAACRTQSSDTSLELYRRTEETSQMFVLSREVKCMHLADRPDVCTWQTGRMFTLSRQVRCLHLAGCSIACTQQTDQIFALGRQARCTQQTGQMFADNSSPIIALSMVKYVHLEVRSNICTQQTRQILPICRLVRSSHLADRPHNRTQQTRQLFPLSRQVSCMHLKAGQILVLSGRFICLHIAGKSNSCTDEKCSVFA